MHTRQSKSKLLPSAPLFSYSNWVTSSWSNQHAVCKYRERFTSPHWSILLTRDVELSFRWLSYSGVVECMVDCICIKSTELNIEHYIITCLMIKKLSGWRPLKLIALSPIPPRILLQRQANVAKSHTNSKASVPLYYYDHMFRVMW